MRDLGQYLPELKRTRNSKRRSGYNIEFEVLTIEAINRAINAEAEVERLQKTVNENESFFTKILPQLTATAEKNAKLRAATTELLEVVEILHPNMNPDEPCVVYEAWEQGKQALAELDKEGVKNEKSKP